jgi:hypothetical protein
MKRLARDPKPSVPGSPVRMLDPRRLRAVQGGSSVIKPEQMIAASDDWEAPTV